MQHALGFMPVIILAFVLCFLVPILARLLKSSRPDELTTDWFENFHTSSYSPMQGLLAPDDFEFLSSQPGFDLSLYRKLKKDRLRIFREYLDRLILDFNRLHTLANMVISQGSDDHSELFARLISLRLQFWLSILKVEFSYSLCRLGIHQISLGVLLSQMDEISQLALGPTAKTLLSR